MVQVGDRQLGGESDHVELVCSPSVQGGFQAGAGHGLNPLFKPFLTVIGRINVE